MYPSTAVIKKNLGAVLDAAVTGSAGAGVHQDVVTALKCVAIASFVLGWCVIDTNTGLPVHTQGLSQVHATAQLDDESRRN
jgi:hypothetical protein